jgi:hypothetical protein
MKGSLDGYKLHLEDTPKSDRTQRLLGIGAYLRSRITGRKPTRLVRRRTSRKDTGDS